MKFHLCLPMLLLVALGCKSEVEVVPVSGTITLRGKPLANVQIITQPIGNEDNTAPGSGSFGKTDADGHFTLELQSEPRPGAIPGEHAVRIREIGEQRPSSDDTATREDYRTQLPPSCRDGSMRFTVPETGTDAMNFDIDPRKG